MERDEPGLSNAIEVSLKIFILDASSSPRKSTLFDPSGSSSDARRGSQNDVTGKTAVPSKATANCDRRRKKSADRSEHSQGAVCSWPVFELSGIIQIIPETLAAGLGSYHATSDPVPRLPRPRAERRLVLNAVWREVSNQ